MVEFFTKLKLLELLFGLYLVKRCLCVCLDNATYPLAFADQIQVSEVRGEVGLNRSVFEMGYKLWVCL